MSGSPGMDRRPRVVAVDVMRAAVLMILLPDIRGGFSFYVMARDHPSDPFWGALASQFRHAPWAGCTIFDLIMPAFVFLVGVSLALSTRSRALAGESTGQTAFHAFARSTTLFVLGMLLQATPQSRVEEMLPYVVLATALPWDRWLGGFRPARAGILARMPRGAIGLALVAAVGTWLALHPDRLGNYGFTHILVLLGLAYFPCYLLMGRGLQQPALAAALILLGWGVAFMAYAPPPGIEPIGEVYRGLFSHWNNGTNVAAAFDRWFLNLLPRSQPYLGNPYGLHTLQFVPLTSNMLVGVVVGRLISASSDPKALARHLGIAGALGIAIGAILAVVWCPLVKSIWTPSWAVFSSGVVVLALAALLMVFETPTGSRIAHPFAVLGSNSILLYVIAHADRWRIVTWWERLLGDSVRTAYARPVIESVLVLLTLWLIAWILDRAKIHVRL